MNKLAHSLTRQAYVKDSYFAIVKMSLNRHHFIAVGNQSLN